MQYLLYSVLLVMILMITYDITPFVFLGAFIMMCIGLYNPKWVIWSKNSKSRTRGKVLKWYGTLSCIAILVVGAIGLTENVDQEIKLPSWQQIIKLEDSTALGDTEKSPGTSVTTTEKLEVHFIDIGQGDAILVDYGDFEMLIDGGDNKYGDTVVDYLKQQDVEVLDYMIGTHMDADHIGGLDVVLEAFPVEFIIDSGTKKDTKTYKMYQQAVEDEKAKYMADEPFTITIDEALSFVIIETGDDYKDENDNSVVVQLNYLDKKFLFTGDMEAHAEAAAIQLFEDVDVLKSGHHGSRTSSSEIFLDKVKAEYAVISCGRDNKYGHPHQETLDKYKKRNMEIYRTDKQGTIICTVNTDGNIIWETTKNDAN